MQAMVGWVNAVHSCIYVLGEEAGAILFDR